QLLTSTSSDRGAAMLSIVFAFMGPNDLPVHIDSKTWPIGDRDKRPAYVNRIRDDARFVVDGPKDVARVLLDLHVAAGDHQMRHRRGADVPFEVGADAA